MLIILNYFSKNCANKLAKITIPPIEEPVHIEVLWLQYENFNCLSEFFNNKLHKHAFYELHFILEGKGIITDSNQKEYTVNSGNAIVVPKYTQHAFKYKNENLQRFSVAFTLPEDITAADLFSDFAITSLSDDVIKKLNTIFAEADKSTALSLYVIKNRLCEIMCEILKLEKYIDTTELLKPKPDNSYVDKSKKYINDNLNIVLTCKDIADYCNINEIYLNRLFKKHTGEALHKYIQRKKIDYSIRLLNNKDLSLNTISAMLGFKNEYYFNTFFKKSTGLPPGAYRNINLKAR